MITRRQLPQAGGWRLSRARGGQAAAELMEADPHERRKVLAEPLNHGARQQKQHLPEYGK